MVIHGSHDGDVSSFNGLRAFQRIRFTDGKPWFKAAWYVYRANHGQWNTVWGNKDNGPRSGRYLDLRGLITPGGAATVQQGDDRRDSSRRRCTARPSICRCSATIALAGAWLPKTMYITRFQESGFKSLATFDEDVDVTTGSVPGVTHQRRQSRDVEGERAQPAQRPNDPLNTNAVTLGWNNHIRGDDTTKLGKPASYTISLSDSLVGSAAPSGARSAIYLSLAPTDAKPGPRAPARDTTKKADSTKKDEKKPPRQEARREAGQGLDARRSHGRGRRRGRSRRRACRSRHFGVPRRPLEIHILRRHDEEQQRYPTQFELVLQTYVLPLADFAQASPQFDPTRLRSIRLVFDRLVAGTVVVDDIGVSATAGPFLALGEP